MRRLPPLFAALALLTTYGCQGATADAASETRGVIGPDKVYRNAKGNLECPIMDVEMKGEKDAVAKVQHKGVTYYLCCESCRAMFEQDPASLTR